MRWLVTTETNRVDNHSLTMALCFWVSFSLFGPVDDNPVTGWDEESDEGENFQIHHETI